MYLKIEKVFGIPLFKISTAEIPILKQKNSIIKRIGGVCESVNPILNPVYIASKKENRLNNNFFHFHK